MQVYGSDDDGEIDSSAILDDLSRVLDGAKQIGVSVGTYFERISPTIDEATFHDLTAMIDGVDVVRDGAEACLADLGVPIPGVSAVDEEMLAEYLALDEWPPDFPPAEWIEKEGS